jgi:hypothetical protein
MNSIIYRQLALAAVTCAKCVASRDWYSGQCPSPNPKKTPQHFVERMRLRLQMESGAEEPIETASVCHRFNDTSRSIPHLSKTLL